MASSAFGPPARAPVSGLPSLPADVISELGRAERVILETLSSPLAERVPRRSREVRRAIKIEEHVRPRSFQKA